MGNDKRHHSTLFFLVVFIVLLLAFFASGLEGTIPPWNKPEIHALSRTLYSDTQPERPQDPSGDLTWGQECGKPGESKDLLDCGEKEGYGYCMDGLRCRQTGRRLDFKCLCL